MDGRGQYEKLERYVLSEYVMEQYSFPRPHPRVKGQAVISNVGDKYSQIPSELSRECTRCGTVYSLQRNGKTKPEACRYHPHRRPITNLRYRCCGGEPGAEPCWEAPYHVHEALDLDNMKGFLLSKDNTSVTASEAYAVDTEMIYTEGGLEVVCLSVVNTKCEVVYQTKVVPDNPILDYNTMFSKLSSSDFRGVTTTMKDVHEKLLTLWGPNTILVGHGLGRDLIKLRVIHDKVVDIQVLYPHKRGLPFINSLLKLKEIYMPYLTYAIGCYKSSKDAILAMKLALRMA